MPPHPENPNLWEMLGWKKYFGVFLEILVTFALIPDSKKFCQMKTKTKKKIRKKSENLCW